MGILTAGRYIASIDLVDVDELKRVGISCVLFDRDNTCVPRSTKRAPGAVLEWFDRVHAAGLRTCMLYTDIAAGNLAGVRTILVRPQSTSDLWYTHILRVFESLLLSGKIFEGE